MSVVVAAAERKELRSLLSRRPISFVLTRSSLHGTICGFVGVASIVQRPAWSEYQEPWFTEPGKGFNIHWQAIACAMFMNAWILREAKLTHLFVTTHWDDRLEACGIRLDKMALAFFT